MTFSIHAESFSSTRPTNEQAKEMLRVRFLNNDFLTSCFYFVLKFSVVFPLPFVSVNYIVVLNLSVGARGARTTVGSG